MGVKQSNLATPFSTFTQVPYTLKTVPNILQLYKTRSFDFGVDASAVTALLDGDAPLAESVVVAFDRDGKEEEDGEPLPDHVINALSFLSALILCAGLGETEGNAKDGDEQVSRVSTTLLCCCLFWFFF